MDPAEALGDARAGLVSGRPPGCRVACRGREAGAGKGSVAGPTTRSQQHPADRRRRAPGPAAAADEAPPAGAACVKAPPEARHGRPSPRTAARVGSGTVPAAARGARRAPRHRTAAVVASASVWASPSAPSAPPPCSVEGPSGGVATLRRARQRRMATGSVGAPLRRR